MQTYYRNPVLVFPNKKQSEVPEINDRMEDGWEECPLI